MRDKFRKSICIVAAAVLSVTAASFAGCSDTYSNKISGDISGDVVSNGGFAVEKGNYVYFINGAEEYTASNTYGDVVKGALMRIAKSDLASGNYSKTDTVVPMLFVAQNFDAGVYIYGDYVYFASPTTEKDTDGNVQNDWLSFKRAKLDGTEVMKDYYFRSDDNAVQYRFVEVEGVVYCLHSDEKTLYSFNTQTGKDTVLVSGAGSSFYFDAYDAENPVAYYTMAVTQDVDTANSSSASYTQVYSVRADATVEKTNASDAAYTVKGGKTYDFDKSYLDENLDGFDAEDYTTYPYVNLGELVLDGVGASKAFTDTRYSDDDAEKAATPGGYTYTVQAYRDGGLYYTRAGVDGSSTGESGALLYLADSVKNSDDWKSIQGQADKAKIDTVALNTTNASATALFFTEEKNGAREHSYIYVADSKIYKAKAGADGKATETVLLVSSASSATLWKTEGNYLYYYASGTNGNNLTRVDYTGEKSDYPPFAEEKGEYVPTTILALDWNSSWYKPEMIGNTLLYSNAASVGSKSYNYIYAVNMSGSGADGKMTAEELNALNEKYTEVNDYISEFSSEKGDDYLKAAATYYFRTGETKLVDDEQAKAKEEGYKPYYLYSEYAVKEFAAYTKRTTSENKEAVDYSAKFKDENGKYYDVESYFLNRIGTVKDDDADAMEEGWRGTLRTVPEVAETGWKTWQKVLLGVGIGVGVLIVAGAVVAVVVVKKKKAKAAAEEAIVSAGRKKVVIDTTDDKTIDVYSTGENGESEETKNDESTEVPTEGSDSETAQEPMEESEATKKSDEKGE